MPDGKNHGLIYEGIIPSSVMVGGLGNDLPDLLLSADWDPFLPPFERQQKLGLETMNCVQFSFLNVLETLAKFFGVPLNLSDRFMYWASGCTAKGNTFSACFFGFLKYGCCAETLWEWLVAMSREVYGQEPPDDIKAEAMRVFEGWKLSNLRYVPSTIESFKAKLKKGPLWACNEGHAFIITKVDDRIRVFDTYPGTFGNGKGSFPLEYITQIVAAYLIPFTPKNIPMPMLELPDNCFVTGIFENEQKVALHVEKRLIIDDPGLVERQWIARNEDQATHRFTGGPVRTITESDWNSFPHVNFKGEPVA